jgi:DNA-binding PadR family transcriptional regulator
MNRDSNNTQHNRMNHHRPFPGGAADQSAEFGRAEFRRGGFGFPGGSRGQRPEQEDRRGGPRFDEHVGPHFGPRGFHPGSRGFDGGQRRRRKGAARDAILSLLAEKPSNGYGLIKEIADRTGGEWRPSPGSIYPTLQQLVDEGLIEPVSSDTRSDFRLTESGSTLVADNSEQYTKLWERATEDASATGDLRDSLGQLMGVAHQYRISATAEQRAKAVEILTDARKALYRILGE